MSTRGTRKSFIQYELPTEALEKVQGGKRPVMTTRGLGEEGGSVTTMAMGEECGGPITTLAVGEEGGGSYY